MSSQRRTPPSPPPRARARRVASPARGSRYHHGELRRALIDAALDLTRRQGPGTFTFADLCRCVGVSAAAPYRHFESLDQIIAEAALEGFTRLDERTQASFQGADWRARLASCLADYLDFVRMNPGHAVMMFETRAQTVAEPSFNPLVPLELPPPRNATEATVSNCWRAGMASFERFAQGLAMALADSPLAPAVATAPRALETALALFTIMQGIASQWLSRTLPDAWLDDGARQAFERIVLPWALGVAQQVSADEVALQRQRQGRRGEGRRAGRA